MKDAYNIKDRRGERKGPLRRERDGRKSTEWILKTQVMKTWDLFICAWITCKVGYFREHRNEPDIFCRFSAREFLTKGQQSFLTSFPIHHSTLPDSCS
jgi:hypothetical protein